MTDSKFEKDEQVKQIVSQVLNILKQLYTEFDTEILTSYFTDNMQTVVSVEEDEETYSMSYIAKTINISSIMFSSNITLFKLLEKYNKLTRKEVCNG